MEPIRCPKCKEVRGTYLGPVHRQAGPRPAWKCQACNHTWVRRKFPEGIDLDDLPVVESDEFFEPVRQAAAEKKPEPFSGFTRNSNRSNTRRRALAKYVRAYLDNSRRFRAGDPEATPPHEYRPLELPR